MRCKFFAAMSETKRPSPRPTFKLESPHSLEELQRRVRAFLKTTTKLRGTAYDQLIELSIDGNDHHFWSPQILAKVTEHEDHTTTLDVRFGPDPHVWALYVFTYATLTFVAIFALVWGFVQRTLGQSPTAMLIAPAALIAAALVYGAGFVGQGLGSDQMYLLRATLERLVAADEHSAKTESAEG